MWLCFDMVSRVVVYLFILISPPKYYSFVWKLKCVKTSLEMTLSQSKEAVVKNTVPTVKTGQKWNQREAVQHAQSTLQHRDIGRKSG